MKRTVSKTISKPRLEPHRRFDCTLFLGRLTKIGWLSQLPYDFHLRLASLGRWVVLNPGQRLFSSGEPADGLFGISEGICDISVPVTNDEECVFQRAKAGFWFDDCALIEGAPRKVSVEAAESSRIFFIRYKDLQRNLADHPADWYHIHRMPTANLTSTADTLAEMLSLPARARILRLLLRLSDEKGEVAATQEDLGRLTGMSRATFRRSLSDLISAGLVTTNYGRLIITDRTVLEQSVYTPDFSSNKAGRV